MIKKEFNKLVRDKITEIISNKGIYPEYEILGDDNYIKELSNKLLEECNEVLETDNRNDRIEELADLLEVIVTLSKTLNINFKTIEKTRMKKKIEKGGFDSKIFLKSTTLVNL